MAWLYLSIAIAFEILATLSLKASNGFTDWRFGTASLAGYGVAFVCLLIVLKTIPVGVAYALWSGVGIAATGLLGFVLFKQQLDLAAVFGIALILAGVLVLTLFSKTVGG